MTYHSNLRSEEEVVQQLSNNIIDYHVIGWFSLNPNYDTDKVNPIVVKALCTPENIVHVLELHKMLKLDNQEIQHIFNYVLDHYHENTSEAPQSTTINFAKTLMCHLVNFSQVSSDYADRLFNQLLDYNNNLPEREKNAEWLIYLWCCCSPLRKQAAQVLLEATDNDVNYILSSAEEWNFKIDSIKKEFNIHFNRLTLEDFCYYSDIDRAQVAQNINL